MTPINESREGDQAAPVVLVADDNDDIRELAAMWLESHGFRTATAADGEDVLEYLARERPPALIVLDLMMPKLDGWSVLSALQRRTDLAAIPVVVVSATNHFPKGATYFLRKPIDPRALLEIARAHCPRGPGGPPDQEGGS
jgi:CheY-like chemotaxis protein